MFWRGAQMQRRGSPAGSNLDELDVVRRALDALDVAVLVLSADLKTHVYLNGAAAELFSAALPTAVFDAIDEYVLARGSARRMPPALRITVQDRGYYLRVVPSGGAVPLEVVFLRQEVLRDVEVLRILEQQFQISRREYQIVSGLRLGRTNRQIATDLGIAEGTVARHIHRLLERMSVHNRTELVHLVDELVKHTG
jgi:DNA-binding NarL/FixJ family response regulator